MSFELALKEIDKSFTADDGIEIEIRPLEAGDEKALLSFFKNLPQPSAKCLSQNFEILVVKINRNFFKGY